MIWLTEVLKIYMEELHLIKYYMTKHLIPKLIQNVKGIKELTFSDKELTMTESNQ